MAQGDENVSICVMMYMAAQNELNEEAEKNIDAIKDVTPLKTTRTYIVKDTMKGKKGLRETDDLRLSSIATKETGIEFESMFNGRDKDVSDPNIFGWFLERARIDFGACHPKVKILILWGHGGGLVMLNENAVGDGPKTKAVLSAFAEKLEERAKPGASQIQFDLVCFDSCYMCLIETINEFNGIASHVLASSNVVDSSGFPYGAMFERLKGDVSCQSPSGAANMFREVYDKNYDALGPRKRRHLFVCETKTIKSCVDALNALGQQISELLPAGSTDDTNRTFLGNVCDHAHYSHGYVASLTFLKSFESLLPDAGFDPAVLTKLQAGIDQLRAAVLATFSGQLGDTGSMPKSPLIWCPKDNAFFVNDEPLYNALSSSDKGRGGWVSMWRKYHNIATPAEIDPRKSKFDNANTLEPTV
jgi:hypothetical protein